MKTTALAAMLGLVCAAHSLCAQPGWEGGVLLGGATYQGDLVETAAPEFGETQPAFGAFARFFLHPKWALRANLLYGSISGDDRNFSDPSIAEKRGFKFTGKVGEASLLLEYDLRGKRRFPGGSTFRKTISPFGFTGLGLGYIDPSPDFGINGGEPPGPIKEDLLAEYSPLRLSIPAGLGLRFDLGRTTSLSLAGSVHYLFTDYLDGISRAANPDSNDWLWTGGMLLAFRFAPKDTDQDGVVDKEDLCPWLAGHPSARGCPDQDGDGVEDAEDVCPTIAGLPEHNGCADTDGDGIMDLIDGCPELFGFEDTGGCPDRDNDCVADAVDKCPDREGLAEYGGCPDSDGDGLSDNMDPCPLEAGLAENGGCPLPDSDCDGVLDRDDVCPTLDGGDHPLGCPDTDGDGLADNRDRCPDLAGPDGTGGCPDLEEKEKELVTKATSSIRFKTGSSILMPDSKIVLDEITDLMHKYPYYSLRMDGYTDNRGNDQTNLRLSQKRARACYDYLLYKGVSPGRLAHAGYGEADPIGDNNTDAGRRLNRRVEFRMYIPE